MCGFAVVGTAVVVGNDIEWYKLLLAGVAGVSPLFMKTLATEAALLPAPDSNTSF